MHYPLLLPLKTELNKWSPGKKTKRPLKEIVEELQPGESTNEEDTKTKKIKPGVRVLFYGKPGTGKKRAAAWVAKQIQQPVFKLDISQIVSNNLEETQKNLTAIFDTVQKNEAILYLDEAEALFGKRSNVRDAHDRYSNLEVSYLLQKIENYKGLVILTTKRKKNIDHGFIRRISFVIKFP